MGLDKIKQGFDLTKGVFLAYFILVLHVLLIAGIGLLVLFFHGFLNYMVWIFVAGSVAIGISAYLFYRRMKAEGKTLKDVLNSSAFRGQSVEVSLLGGLASFKINRPDAAPQLPDALADPSRQLEDPETVRARQLTELAQLFEKELITREEFNTAKKRLFKS